MERLKNMSLKKSFFCLTAIFLLIALVLSIISILYISEALQKYGTKIELVTDGHTLIVPPNIIQGQEPPSWYWPLSAMQIILPVIFVVAGLLSADMIFYRLKLKKPLAILQSGAERIQRQDLDFTIEKYADDELGALSDAFETMRNELLKNNQELWRQMEERKRLNAAFSHDLRNPVTVLKGSAKILQKGLEQGALTVESAGDTVSLITQYAGRIETYVEAMTNAQKLEEVKFEPKVTDWSVLMNELKSSLSILGANAGKEIQFSYNCDDRQIRVDRYILHNTAENLVSNALRYAKDRVAVDLSCDDNKIMLTVSDNGPGYSSVILSKGAAPFLRGGDTAEQEAHFGMGLYICRLLCEKHGGALVLENTPNGAKATAAFYF